MSSRINFGFAFALSLLLAGCIRYVPSRSEITQDKSEAELAESGLLGADAFRDYEKGLKSRAEALMSARSSLASAHSEDSYRLGAGDILDFDVYGLPNLRTEIEVSPSGTAAFPLLNGEVSAADKTLFEMKKELQRRMSRYVKNPQIRLSVKDFHAHNVAVTGAVAKPGIYPLKRGAPLVSEMIAEAGGRNDKAGNRVLLIPASQAADPNAAAVDVDFEDLIGGSGNRPLLIPVIGGDTIIIPEAGTYEVEGEVKAPGSYKITSKKSVMSAIAAAGGFGYAAKVREVEVIREIGAGKKAFVALNLEDIALKGADDIRVRDGDLIRVPTQSGRHIERQIVEGINAIFRGVGVQGRMN